MAFDAVPDGDPRGPWCPRCGQTILAGQTWTIVHFASDPYGDQGLSGRRWHSDCAGPHGDKLWDVLERLQSFAR